jgi:hypothetical protein
MRQSRYLYLFAAIAISCADNEVVPQNKLALLSGEMPTGKQWRMTSLKTVSNYCTPNIKEYLTTESWDTQPVSIKDNITTIFQNGYANIDEGAVHYNNETPQVFVGKQLWTVVSDQDSVDIVDFVGLPSIHGTWGLDVNKDKIVLTRKEVDLVFKGSLLNQYVIYRAVDGSIEY